MGMSGESGRMTIWYARAALSSELALLDIGLIEGKSTGLCS